jgi:hypothetical protein
MKIRFAVAFVCGVGIGISAPPVNAQDAEELLPMPYLDRITALQPPINALIRYAPTDKRQFVTQIVWGPEKAPNLYQMRATGEVWIDGTSDAPIVNIERAATEVAFGPKQSQRPDAGQIFANISPLGAFKLLKLDLHN